MSCVEKSTVAPVDLEMSLRTERTIFRFSTSRKAVGSSRRMTLARRTSAMAVQAFWNSPSLIRPRSLDSISCSPRSLTAFSSAARTSGPGFLKGP